VCSSDLHWDEPRTTLRLKLRPNIYFHDGTPMTPEIAAETVRTMAADEGALVTLKDVVDVRGEGADVVIRVKEPTSFLLADLGLSPVAKPGKPDVGTGPYQLVSRDGKDAKLKSFPEYYRGQPQLAGVEVKNYPTQRNAWSALMRGEIDMLYEVSREAADFVEAESTVRSYSFPRPYYISLNFNVRRPVFRDPRVRQAINQALDRATLLRDGLNSRGEIADGPVPSRHWAYSPPATPFAFDTAAARRLLDGTGEKPRQSSPGAVPMRFSFTCAVFANDTRYDRLDVLVQKELADVGIEMKLEPLPIDQFTERLGKGDFDAYMFENAGRTLGWAYEFWRSHPHMFADTGYRAADAAFDRLKAARDDDEVKRAVADIGRIFHDDPPAAFLLWQQQVRAVSTKFDVAAEDNRDILSNLWQWRPAGPPK